MAKKSRRKSNKKGNNKSFASSKEGGYASPPARGASPDTLREWGYSRADIDCKIDDQLFIQGTTHNHLGECPLCMIPHSLDLCRATYQTCCSALICNGCWVASGMEFISAPCPFCRVPKAQGQAEMVSRAHKRRNVGDADATHFLGTTYRHAFAGHKKNLSQVIRLYTQAAQLGSIEAHFELGEMYRMGEGVRKNLEKSTFHLSTAAMAGHHGARYLLGVVEIETGRQNLTEVKDENCRRALKHFMIASKLGHKQALSAIKDFYRQKCVVKEDYLEALMGYQKTVEECKSPQREMAEEILKGRRKKIHYRYGDSSEGVESQLMRNNL